MLEKKEYYYYYIFMHCISKIHSWWYHKTHFSILWQIIYKKVLNDGLQNTYTNSFSRWYFIFLYITNTKYSYIHIIDTLDLRFLQVKFHVNFETFLVRVVWRLRRIDVSSESLRKRGSSSAKSSWPISNDAGDVDWKDKRMVYQHPRHGEVIHLNK